MTPVPYTGVEIAALNFAIPPAIPDVSCMPPAQRQLERESQD